MAHAGVRAKTMSLLRLLERQKMIKPLLMTSVRVNTFLGAKPMTGASGFFFQRDGRLFLASSRHVFLDEASNHRDPPPIAQPVSE
ncbi:MAG: hypothetical protein AAFX03_01835 [Pseudomonadota bacterium]